MKLSRRLTRSRNHISLVTTTMSLNLEAAMPQRLNKAAAITDLREVVTLGATSAGRVTRFFTHITIPSKGPHRIRLLLLEIRFQHLQLDGTMIWMTPIRMYTMTPGLVHSVITVVLIGVPNMHNMMLRTFLELGLNEITLGPKHCFIRGTRTSLLVRRSRPLSHHSRAHNLVIQICIVTPQKMGLCKGLHQSSTHM